MPNRPFGSRGSRGRTIKARLRLRDLRFAHINAWPPTWRAVLGRRPAIAEEGTLVGARARSPHSVTIWMVCDHEDYEGLLTWEGPIAAEAIAQLLNGAAGLSIRDAGDLFVPTST